MGDALTRRSAALRAEPQASQAKPATAIARDGRFLLKAWDVTVSGYGAARINAASRGKALSKAWRSDAFSRLAFGDFLKIATAHRALLVDEDYGAAITVCGKPAFYVTRDRAYVYLVYPGGENVLHAHPYDVEPERYRPEVYRTALAAGSRRAKTPQAVECEASQSGPTGQRPDTPASNDEGER